jgi:3-hydroxyisobutyrate dehydrogenase
MTTPSGAPVAVLGLGAMGLAMAQHLTQTHTVFGFDVLPSKTSEAAASGILPAATAAEAAGQAGVVVVSVRDGAQLESVTSEVADAMASGSVLLVTSTVGADAIRKAADALAARQVHVVDAPVSGGPVRAGKGDLLIMAGGTPEGLAAGREVLDELASTLVLTGGIGSGQDFKTVNQLLCGIHTAAAGEALALAHTLGLDLDQVIAVLSQGAAASFMFSDRGPRMAQRLRGETPPLRSRLVVIAKDMGIVGDLTRSHKVATPVAGAAEQLYRLGLALGLAAEDDSIVTTVLHTPAEA